jgi:hypothetical protein
MAINQFSMQTEVDRLFDEMGARRGDYCRNPVTGGAFVWGVDPIQVQKRDAVRALLAREWFAEHAPAGAPPLPLSPDEIEDARNAGGVTGVIGFYARSLACRQWDVQQHPSPMDFARGLMASDLTGWGIAQDPELHRLFPPRQLTGMGPDLRWRPEAEHTRHMDMVNRVKLRPAA